MAAPIWKNPWVIGGAVAGVALLVYLGSGSSGSSTGGVASQSVATSANVQLAGLTSQLDINGQNANAAVVLGQQHETTTLVGGLLSFLTNGSNNSTALAAQSSQINGAIATNRDNNQATLTLAPQLATINATSQQALASISADATLAGIRDTNATKLATAGLQQQAFLQTAVPLANIQAAVAGNLAQISANESTQNTWTIAHPGASAAAQSSGSGASDASSIIGAVAPLALAALAFI